VQGVPRRAHCQVITEARGSAARGVSWRAPLAAVDRTWAAAGALWRALQWPHWPRRALVAGMQPLLAGLLAGVLTGPDLFFLTLCCSSPFRFAGAPCASLLPCLGIATGGPARVLCARIGRPAGRRSPGILAEADKAQWPDKYMACRGRLQRVLC